VFSDIAADRAMSPEEDVKVGVVGKTDDQLDLAHLSSSVPSEAWEDVSDEEQRL